MQKHIITIIIITNTTTPATIPPIKPPVEDDDTTTVPEDLGYVKITVVDGIYETGVTYVTGVMIVL